ncbi:Abi family protein, partial [Acinetobacter junii]|uniref:Abi family protein n=1 Tax=Acinetobacter junii TaxID=40215 RepID=UPI003EDEEC3B
MKDNATLIELNSSDNSKRLQTFHSNVEFDTLIDISLIDSELRSLILAAIDRIEVEVRNVINHELSIKYNSSHLFLNETLFQCSDQFKHRDFLSRIKQFTSKKADAGSEKEKLRETFIHH